MGGVTHSLLKCILGNACYVTSVLSVKELRPHSRTGRKIIVYGRSKDDTEEGTEACVV